ncbi:MAG: hypothetical protein AUG74_10010 [Bacteroidetes bacterium 13_1_20CM_4_60_6]|nr:MAG: hypothetical protein AUG74_10010 [Bacteroidetes bacterium 13_1_20CM_4_60_6]
MLAGLFVLQQKRNVGFVDQRDQSITWRETVWREGFHLLVSKPRHLLVGVGMDSIKAHWREWGLFDGGRIPVGHMHSTPLQFALERGVPVLLMWILLVVVYARMLWQLARRECLGGWVERGIVLGALGGLVGFLTSGMVHYNFGDSEVVMIFYLMMGLSLVVEREPRLIVVTSDTAKKKLTIEDTEEHGGIRNAFVCLRVPLWLISRRYLQAKKTGGVT